MTDTIKDDVARIINDSFGGQEWESHFWLSPKGRQVARWTFLAPDWTLSNARIAGRPVFQVGNKTVRRIGLKYWMNMAFVLGASHIGLQALAYSLAGDEDKGDHRFPWQNEVGHKFDIDVTPLMRKMPWRDKESKQRYYIHFGKQAREVLGWIMDPIRTAGVKMSPAVQAALEQLTGHSAGSGFPMEWKRGEYEDYNPSILDTAPLRIKAVAKKFTPFSLRGNNFAFAAPMSKGMTPFKARRALVSAFRGLAEPGFLEEHTKGRATKAQLQKHVEDILDAAEANGLDRKRVFGQGLATARTHYYRKLFTALNKKDMGDAEEAALSLRRLGTSLKSIGQSGERRGAPKADIKKAKKLAKGKR